FKKFAEKHAVFAIYAEELSILIYEKILYYESGIQLGDFSAPG
ncbi:MAG: hypothetical protein ACJAY2_003197, partial [Pseudomonadales bacterium]